ncbi:hypothetical protein [Promicromonospora sp. NFX87]|uniref:hypothetical protein n=1 Tax=Promicromonospora sp. NFX87 TaxID=3402691 RepID=UPI003AFAA709
MSEHSPSKVPSPGQNEQLSPAKQTFGCLVVLLVVVGIPAAGIYAFVQWSNKPLHQVAEDLRDYGTLCSGREIPGAPAYTPGSGPHPIAVFESVREGDEGLSDVWIRSGETGDPFNPENPGVVELVACAERTDAGEVVATCDFTGESVGMRSATAEITVYEARTANQVGESVKVVGEDTSCPGFVTFKGALKLYSIPSESQFLGVLESVVND